MRAVVLFTGLTLSQAAWADCVYTGAKGPYVRCIYDAVLAVAADLLGLESEVEATSSSIPALQAVFGEEFAVLNRRIDHMESDLVSHGTTIDIYHDDVVELEDDFALVTSRVEDLELDLGGVQAEVASHGVTIDIYGDSVVELEDDFGIMSSRVTALETTVGTLVTELSAAQSAISNLETELADAEGRLDAEETAGLRSAWISGNSGTISIAQQHGAPFLSGISKLGVGGYRGSFAAGTWSSTPHCFCAPFHFGGLSNMICNISQVSTTVVDLVVTDVAGTVRDRDAWLFCLQP
jgi:hypothetical protein